MTDCLITDQTGGVLTLTLNRPQARNALNLELTSALGIALENAKQSPEVKAIVLTGTPPAFCAGLDLKAFSPPDAPRHLVTLLITSIPRLGKPIIAAVNGAAYTGGLELALGCDFIIAGQSARFADTHARIGALSGSGMSAMLPNAVGVRWARQMILSCMPVNAATALSIGLVNEIVADEQVVAHAQAIAAAISQHDPELVALAKSVLDRGNQGTLHEALQIERETLAARKASAPMMWK